MEKNFFRSKKNKKRILTFDKRNNTDMFIILGEKGCKGMESITENIVDIEILAHHITKAFNEYIESMSDDETQESKTILSNNMNEVLFQKNDDVIDRVTSNIAPYYDKRIKIFNDLLNDAIELHKFNPRGKDVDEEKVLHSSLFLMPVIIKGEVRETGRVVNSSLSKTIGQLIHDRFIELDLLEGYQIMVSPNLLDTSVFYDEARGRRKYSDIFHLSGLIVNSSHGSDLLNAKNVPVSTKTVYLEIRQIPMLITKYASAHHNPLIEIMELDDIFTKTIAEGVIDNAMEDIARILNLAVPKDIRESVTLTPSLPSRFSQSIENGHFKYANECLNTTMRLILDGEESKDVEIDIKLDKSEKLITIRKTSLKDNQKTSVYSWVKIFSEDDEDEVFYLRDEFIKTFESVRIVVG
jgi:hypothetical protein